MTAIGASVPNERLANGVLIPVLGFGTYKLTEHVQRVVQQAIEIGYRHIDTAQMYGNEAEVGQAWKQSGVAREELFLTSKLDNPNHAAPDVFKSFEQTLRDLQTDYVDLFLIHWPLPDLHPNGYGEVWGAMEQILADGGARAIGTSNFYQHHLEVLLQSADVAPHINQFESHPYLPQNSLHAFDRAHQIATEAWSPLARGKVVEDPLLQEIGARHGKSAAQVAIRWGLQRGDILFPKSSTPARQLENFDVFDFRLSEEDLEIIGKMDHGAAGRVGSHPDQRA